MIYPIPEPTDNTMASIDAMIQAERDEQNDALTDLLVQHIATKEDNDKKV